MRSHALGFALGFFLVAALRADDSLTHARQAQAMLGPDVWSRVIRIENEGPAHRYPRTLHALVFELDGLLWFYTDADGTQSFSLRRDRLAEEKADFGPLLHDIEPGFRRWHEVPAAAGAAPVARGPLRNGCFIESVVAWRSVGGGAAEPQLLAYYEDTPSGVHGHTVLTYERGGRPEVFDPEPPARRVKFSATEPRDALALARAFGGRAVSKARLLPLHLPAPREAVVAAPGGDDAASPLASQRIVTVR